MSKTPKGQSLSVTVTANLGSKSLEPKIWHAVLNGWLYWDPHFIDQQEATQLYGRLRHTLQWREDEIMLFGQSMRIPRLQAWYGDESYRYSNLTMAPTPWLPLLLDLKSRCEVIANTGFNSVLANLYRDGNDSNGWHSDNEPELGAEPIIASLSFGETRKFHLKHKHTHQKYSFELNSGSILIMAGEMQNTGNIRCQKPRGSKPKELT